MFVQPTGEIIMVLKTPKDIESERRDNNTILIKSVPLSERQEALQLNERLKKLEAYAKTLDKTKIQDFDSLVSEYNGFTDDLTASFKVHENSLQEIIQQIELLKTCALNTLEELQVMKSAVDRASVIGGAIQSHYSRISAKFLSEEKRCQQLEEEIYTVKQEKATLQKAFELREKSYKESEKAIEKVKVEKQKKLPEPEYKKNVLHYYGRNKGLDVLRDEGYDV